MVNLSEIKQRVDELYSTAGARFPTYDTIVHRAFCEAMLQAFPEQDSDAGAPAYAYAREAYGYLTPEEIAAEDEINDAEGICSHGLDYWTCPCGCFD